MKNVGVTSDPWRANFKHKPSLNLCKPQLTISVTLESRYLRIPSKTYTATTILSYPPLHLNDAILLSFLPHYRYCNS